MDRLEQLGYDHWFQSHVDNDLGAGHDVARVISVHRDRCAVTKGSGPVGAECSGNLLYSADSPLDLPTTGDWILADFFDDDTHAIIHRVLPRKSLLKRKTPGKRIDFQLIAANIDTAFIMQSADYNLNPRRLERYLAMVHDGGITPVILVSKCDLIAADERHRIDTEISQVAGTVPLISFSNLTGEHIDTIEGFLKPAQTYCLIGSSGVGKTTLLNRLIGSRRFETREVSTRDRKGKHTTASRELVQLKSGAVLIDTPGMRELGNLAIDSGIGETFPEISMYAEQCRFRDCSHDGEAGCAVLAAVHAGELDENRYANYLKLRSESQYHSLSYAEKRKKDKDFGKMVKSVLKSGKRYR